MKLIKIFSLILCAVFVCLFTSCGEMEPIGNVPTEPVELAKNKEGITIGVWNGSYHVFEEPQLAQLVDAGITLIIGVDEQWTGNGGALAVLERAKQAGVQVIMDIRNWDGVTKPAYLGHPAVDGYLAWDEPSALNFIDLNKTKEAFEKISSEEDEFYVNLLGNAASFPSLYGVEAERDYEKEYLEYYVDGLGLKRVAYDFYGLLDGGSAIRPGYYENFEIAARIAKERNLPFQYTLLSSGHATTDAVFEIPTEEQLRWQMALGLTFGAKELVHYTYTSHEEGYDTMIEYNSFVPKPLYDDVKKVNLEYLNWDEIYCNYNWVGISTLDKGDKNEALRAVDNILSLDEMASVEGIDASGDLLIGVFEDSNKNPAYMFTNAGESTDGGVHNKLDFEMGKVTALLTFEKGCKKVAVIQKGETSFYDVDQSNILSLEVDSYEGIFVIPIYE